MVGAVEFSVDVAGEIQIKRRFEGLIGNIEDLTPALERIANHFQAHIEKVFETEGGATRGGAWKPLSKPYAARKAKTHPGKGILERRGDLRKAMTGKGPGAIRNVGPQELEIGASVRTPNGKWDLGLIHQLGSRDGRVPMRPIIDLPETVKTQMVREIADHLWREA